mmetsp:Transcript_24792/g.49337  ORF Transcript_24792/g.49337 Transcript_24792/m.49337 type:complete len:123 (+) Transcript_24792:198-566(+)
MSISAASMMRNNTYHRINCSKSYYDSITHLISHLASIHSSTYLILEQIHIRLAKLTRIPAPLAPSGKGIKRRIISTRRCRCGSVPGGIGGGTTKGVGSGIGITRRVRGGYSVEGVEYGGGVE